AANSVLFSGGPNAAFQAADSPPNHRGRSFASLVTDCVPGSAEGSAMKLVRLVGPFVFALAALAGPACADGTTVAGKVLVGLDQADAALHKGQCRGVRGVVAEQLEAKHQAVVGKASGDDYDRLTAWLKTGREIKEEFSTALGERRDKLEAALALFKESWK